jgi:transcriptional regulator with XRE-family HTH domain
VPATPAVATTSGTTDPEGVITGSLLREIRRRLGLHQDKLADLLKVDLNTYRSWENGRRALGRVSVSRMRALSQGLIRIGADSQLVDLLDTAVDVDLNIGEILANHTAPDEHPLAGWVQTRVWNDLFAWGITGTAPRILAGIHEVAKPRLSPVSRAALLDRLRDSAEQTKDRVDPAATLLRRQVYYVASLDRSGTGKDWLRRMEQREVRRMRASDGWTPTWVAGRSIAVAKAISGDPEQLRHFITHQLAGDDQEIANLNYWANWAGDDSRPALSDEFMHTAELGPWRGAELLRQLAEGLKPTNPYIDLTVHSIAALLKRKSGLLDDDPLITQKLVDRAQQLLDYPDPLSDQARRELDQISYGIKMRRNR